MFVQFGERRALCFEVTSYIGDGISHHGVGRTLNNICNTVFVQTRLSSVFGFISRKSESSALFPCLLLFAQDLFLVCWLSLCVRSSVKRVKRVFDSIDCLGYIKYCIASCDFWSVYCCSEQRPVYGCLLLVACCLHVHLCDLL